MQQWGAGFKRAGFWTRLGQAGWRDWSREGLEDVRTGWQISGEGKGSPGTAVWRGVRDHQVRAGREASPCPGSPGSIHLKSSTARAFSPEAGQRISSVRTSRAPDKLIPVVPRRIGCDGLGREVCWEGKAMAKGRARRGKHIRAGQKRGARSPAAQDCKGQEKASEPRGQSHCGAERGPGPFWDPGDKGRKSSESWGARLGFGVGAAPVTASTRRRLVLCCEPLPTRPRALMGA